ncbi:MAG: glutamate--tRNA ligase [Dehalococcoidia bacterium]
MTVRLRYAPSPTGDPHVGNIRSALWAWAYARHEGGVFYLRIEDTDQTRLVPGSVERIEESLRWLGLDWDEGPDIGGPHGPYVQSQRLDHYRDASGRLLATENAYRCFCTPADLEAMREAQRAAKQPPGYDGRCRSIPPAEAAARAAAGEAFVVRFAMPREGTTTFTDLLRGEITYENRLLDDFVILKSDGFPTYHLAHAVDDHLMATTHVTRGDEWLPSAPRHVRLFEALGHPVPIYVHTPVILGPDGGKLSKRHGAKSVLEYAADGYLPDALFNFLSILGWSPDGSTELLSRAQVVDAFDIKDLVVHPAVFDTQKLEWMNGVYMRSMAEDELADVFARELDRALPLDVPRPLDRVLVAAITPLVRERVKLLPEVTALVDFFFAADVPAPAPEQLRGKAYRDRPDAAAPAVDAVVATLEALDAWDAATLEERLRAVASETGEKPGDLFMLCRLAVTGKNVTPPLFESMELVGRDHSLARLRRAADVLRGATG